MDGPFRDFNASYARSFQALVDAINNAYVEGHEMSGMISGALREAARRVGGPKRLLHRWESAQDAGALLAMLPELPLEPIHPNPSQPVRCYRPLAELVSASSPGRNGRGKLPCDECGGEPW